MKMQYDEGTVFDEVVNTLKGMLKLHRKGSKSESTFSDIHFIQAATLLCASLFSKHLILSNQETSKK